MAFATGVLGFIY